MGIVHDLSALALKQVIGGACDALNCGAGAGAVLDVAKFLIERFSDQSQRLNKALRDANDRAWKAFEIALSSESLWARCKTALASGEDREFSRQIRAFLDAAPLANIPDDGPDFRRRCTRELRAARKANLLTGGDLGPRQLAEQAGAFVRFADPHSLLDAEWQLVGQMAETLTRAGCANLGRLVALRPPDGTSVLVLGVRYFFRRAVEEDPKLAQGLAFARMEKLAAGQEQGFAALADALAQQGQRLEELLGDVKAVVVQTHGAVLDLHDQLQGQSEQIRHLGEAVQQMLEQHQLQRRELRPSDSLSIRGDAERHLVRQLVSRYRALPEAERRQLPALLNALGKLEVVAGDFEAAQRDFQQTALLAEDPGLKAEARYHAYQAALQRREWTAALLELLAAVRLDARRLAPFPMGKFHPHRILGAGGFGVAFLCKHKYLDAFVVVKALMEGDLDQGVERVFAEGMVLRQLDHPAIIRMQDCGFADPPRKARPYLVMDYFEGLTLEEQANKAALTSNEGLAVARLIAAGLQAAHAQGVLHRDVKPANVLVRQDAGGWQVKLIDFGLALRRNALHSSQATSKTLLGSSIAGTLDYAAPEQLGRLEGVPVSQASDVYGFAKTCCYALFQTPEPTLRHWQSIPTSLAELLGSCLEKMPDRRPANFGVVLAKLTELSAPAPPVALLVPTARVHATAMVASVAIPVAVVSEEAERHSKGEQERQLREAAAKAVDERRRLEEQEKRLREVADRAETERRRLEDREQRWREDEARRQDEVLEALPVPTRRKRREDIPEVVPVDDPPKRQQPACGMVGCWVVVLGLAVLVMANWQSLKQRFVSWSTPSPVQTATTPAMGQMPVSAPLNPGLIPGQDKAGGMDGLAPVPADDLKPPVPAGVPEDDKSGFTNKPP